MSDLASTVSSAEGPSTSPAGGSGGGLGLGYELMGKPSVDHLGALPPALAAALVQAQKNAKAIGKSSKNTVHDYDYTSMDDLIEGGKVALNDAGLAIIPGSLWQERFTVGANNATAYNLERLWMVVHESGAVLQIKVSWPLYLQNGKRPRDKAVSAADTTALGYLYRDLLAIPRLAADQMDARDDTGTTEPGADPNESGPHRKREEAKAPKPSTPKCKSGKRGYQSKVAARRAHSTSSARLRIYRCPDCHEWHVTNDEKNKPAEAKASGRAAAAAKAKPPTKKKADPPKAKPEPPPEPAADAPAPSADETTPTTSGVSDSSSEPTDAETAAEVSQSDLQPETSSDEAAAVEATPEPESPVQDLPGEGETTKRGKTDLGQTYGDKAADVAEEQRAELSDEELDAEVRKALALGITPSTTNDELIVDLPPNPGADDLEAAGWPREIAEELANYEEADPISRKVLNVITRKAAELLGYNKLSKEAKAILIPAFLDVGIDVKNTNRTTNGYQLRLWALAIATIANADEEVGAAV